MNVTVASAAPAGSTSMWQPLRNRHFRRFIVAAVVSNAGSWMQTVAVPFTVYTITNSISWLGFSAFLGLIVSMVANTPGGLLADRYSRRLVLGATQVLQMMSALMLWALWRFGHPSIASMMPLIVLGSIGAGLSMPGWQSFVPSLVPTHEVPAAVRLNSTQFAIARAVGPILGALTLKMFGASFCFMANAITYLAIIVVLIPAPEPEAQSTEASDRSPLKFSSILRDFSDGWRYLLSDPGLSYAPMAVFVNAAFGFGLTTLAPAMARDQFHHNANDNGILISAFGLGGVVSVIAIGMFAKNLRNSIQVRGAFTAWVVAGAILAVSGNFWIGFVAWLIGGSANSVGATALNTSVQMQVDDAFRGRVMATYMQMFFLGSALGSFALGLIADYISLRAAALSSCVVFVGFHVWSVKRYAGLRMLDTRRDNGRMTITTGEVPPA
jgi:MFS family permease